MRRRSGDGGQILPLMAVVIVLAGLACLVTGRIGAAAVSRARAVTAADSAALAGAAAGLEAARSAAESNGARLVDYRQLGTDTRVEVEVNEARATARARATDDPVAAPPGRLP
ncbi:MAG TPA: pilus assembly protein TadG-related protein [Acidimicrobiales bacterium]|nr:pilus assembly protein TadG-related protein [Acidimicrobiales bacterium]